MASPKKKTSKLKGISRIDSDTTHAWFVRASKNGEITARIFSDGKHGGKDAAFKEALKYRDELYTQLDIPTDRRAPYNGPPVMSSNSKNATGTVGVQRHQRMSEDGKTVLSDSYVATWSPEPWVKKAKHFSVTVHGEKEALKLAIAHRRKMVKQILEERGKKKD